MIRIVSGTVTDEDGQALQSTPDGWTIVLTGGMWYAAPSWSVGSDMFDPMGPFATAAEAVDAANASEMEGW